MSHSLKIVKFSYNGYKTYNRRWIHCLLFRKDKLYSSDKDMTSVVVGTQLGDEGKEDYRLSISQCKSLPLPRWGHAGHTASWSTAKKIQVTWFLQSIFFPWKRFLSLGESRVVVSPKSLVKRLLSSWRRCDNRQFAHFRPRPCHPPIPYQVDRLQKGQGDNKNRNDHQGIETGLWTRLRVWESGSRIFWTATSLQNACAKAWKKRTVNLPSW